MNFQLNDAGGWGFNPGFGNDLEFSFSLKQVILYLGGVSTSTILVPNSTEFANLFQEYKLDSVDMTMFYTANSNLTTSTVALPLLNIAFDPNDVNAVGLAAIQQYSGVRQIQLGNGADSTKSFTYRPRAAVQLFENAVTSGYMSERSGWINTAYTDIPHYGVKIVYDPGFSPGVSTSIGYVQFYFKLNFSLKGLQ